MKKIALALLVIFIAMQFYRPEKNIARGESTKVFFTDTNPPSEVKVVLKNACYDCHSNNTKYPWYNNIAPVSYWLANHVNEGKDELNFSEWESYSVKKKDHKLEEIAEMVQEGSMPLKEYTWTHDEAKLSELQKTSIIEWVNKTRSLYQLNQKPQ